MKKKNYAKIKEKLVFIQTNELFFFEKNERIFSD